MNKLKYAFYHGKIVLIILIIAIILLSSFISDTISQINSAKNGIEVLLIDTSVSLGGKNLEKDIKKITDVKYIGTSTLIKKDAEEYVKTIENYTLQDYIYYLTISKNCEALFVTEGMLQSIYTLKNIVPLSVEGEFGQECYHNGVLFAFPMKKATNQNSSFSSLQEDTYMVLLSGDHLNEMRQYLNYLVAEAQ
ncbi:MAG: hypothetical protein E7365_06395 [Clostridiales bacterium]|nr:hypothetical protein [Clostridiales bacterium]